MVSRRSARVERLLRDAISQVMLHDVVDPRMGFVTVTKVSVADDLKTAKVFVSIIGSETDVSKTFAGLQHALGFIQRRAAAEIKLKYIPRLKLVLDDSVKRSVRISELLHRAGVEGGDDEDDQSESS